MEAGRGFEDPSKGRDLGRRRGCHDTGRGAVAQMMADNSGQRVPCYTAERDVTCSVLSALTLQRSELGTGTLCSCRLSGSPR